MGLEMEFPMELLTADQKGSKKDLQMAHRLACWKVSQKVLQKGEWREDQ